MTSSRSHFTVIKFMLVLLALSMVAAACSDSDSGSSTTQSETATTVSADPKAQSETATTVSADPKAEWPDPVIFALLPTEDAEVLTEEFKPFVSYMNNCLDTPVEAFVAVNYTAVIEAMRFGNAHVMRVGPFAYTLAHERAGAEAIVLPTGNKDNPTYRSEIITLERYGFNELSDLEGATFAFVDPASSSGYMYPRQMLLEEFGLANDEIDDWFGDVVFSGGHAASIVSVLNGDVEAAAVASVNATKDGEYDDHPNWGEYTILAETREIPGTVEAIQGDLPASLREALTACYLGIIDDPSMTEFLAGLGATDGYILTNDAAYDIVRDTAAALGLDPATLLK